MCVHMCVISSKFVKLSRKFYFPVDVGEVIDPNSFVFFSAIKSSLVLHLGKTCIYS